jgi:outer membrane biosynthesis protein TonB
MAVDVGEAEVRRLVVRLKRIALVAMLLGMGLLVAVDSGLMNWTTFSLAHHKDDPKDKNEKPTDEDDEDEDEQPTGKQRCRERPDPRKCRNRKDKQERKAEKKENDAKKDDDAKPSPTPTPTPTPAPADCPFEAIPVLGPALCDLIGDGVPIALM